MYEKDNEDKSHSMGRYFKWGLACFVLVSILECLLYVVLFVLVIFLVSNAD